MPRLGCLLLLLWLGAGPVWSQELHWLSPQALAERLDRREPPLLLDIRGRAAYLDGSLAGAIDAGRDPAGFLPDGRGGEVVLLPGGEQDLGAWYRRLADYGHRVYLLSGGIEEWRAAGLPVERPEVSFTRPGTVPFVIPRGLCELNEPAEVFE